MTKLAPETSSSQVSAYVTSVATAPLVCKRLKTKYESYASFYVAVDDETYQKLQDPGLWPTNCLFKPFQGILFDRLLHASELEIEQVSHE